MSLVACGGDSKKATPDAPQQSDAAPDTAPACSSLTAPSGSNLDATAYNPNKAFVVAGPGGDIGDGNALSFSVEFYETGSAGNSLAGTFDLSQGDFANYKMCPVCVLSYSVDAQGNPLHVFFQKSGMVTLAADPFSNGHLTASFSNVEMQEVTIAQDYTSTPVPNGLCASYGSFTLDHGKAPNAYTTCAASTYADGTCDCTCGGGGSAAVPDEDCATVHGTVNGCTTGQTCYYDDTCVTAPANDTCGTAIPITLAVAANGTTVNAANNYDAGLEAQTMYPQPGSDVAYSIVLTANQAITVALTNPAPAATFDPSITLVGPGTAAAACEANPITAAVAGADANGAGMGETFTYTATTAGTYYIIVDSFYTDQPGTFTLTVN